jgi:hypothetical protein
VAPDAESVSDGLRKDVEGRLGEVGDLRPISGFASKLPGVIARIALAFEAMQDPAAPTVSAATMRAAMEWAPFLLAHFRAVLGDASEGDDVKRRNLTELSAREAFNLLDGGSLQTMEELDPALALLLETEWLRELPTPPPGPHRPPSPRYAVNPAALTPDK